MLMFISAIGTIIWLLIKGLLSSAGAGVVSSMFSLKGDEINKTRFVWLLVSIQFGLAFCAFLFRYVGATHFPDELDLGPIHIFGLLGEAAVSVAVGYWLGGLIVRRILDSRKLNPLTST